MALKNKKLALVTGANKGIGFEITRQLAFKGFSVIMCGRNKARLEQSAGMLRGEGHDVIPTELDVTSEASIAKLAAEMAQKNMRLDVLINNAAVLLDGAVDILKITESEILTTLRTNTIGPLVMTQRMAPFLKDGSRVVMLSSGAGAVCDKFSSWAPIYSMSKTALNAITRQLAAAFEDRNIAVNAVDPGWVKTSMGGSEAHRNVNEGAETPVWLATEAAQSETGKFWRDNKIVNW